MQPQPEGPILDWLASLIAALWSMVLRLVAEFLAGVQAVKVELADLARELGWLPWKLVGLAVVLVVIHALITRSKP